ncbi:MAG: hypothetical protein Q8Q39_00425 [bacterium]|nr:hypothetical protein [bacterium]
MENKWSGLDGEEYTIEDLGRPAIFLLPSHKLRSEISGKSIEEDLHQFLSENFGAFTTTAVPYFGFWRGSGTRVVYDESRLYEVSFAGKDRIPLLLDKLARVARVIGEECIYFKAGQYACLVYPKQAKK